MNQLTFIIALSALAVSSIVSAHPSHAQTDGSTHTRETHLLITQPAPQPNATPGKTAEVNPSTSQQSTETTKTTDTQILGTNNGNKLAGLSEADGARVTVLGYHDFSSQKKATEMLISTEKFRMQMQAIKNLGLQVISMEEFLQWKRGEKKISDKSVLITIDDGWKSVYTEAFPILKEYGYPFTVFLYTNYVDGGGSALTSAMIKEMQQNGCTIGCHSISHPYPKKIRSERAKGDDSFTTYLHKEMGDSKTTLEKKFGQKVLSYAYPGGFITEEMLPVAKDCGYECLFTVLPGKVTAQSSKQRLPRYIILGTHDYIFRNATSFKATSSSSASQGAFVSSTPHPVSPKSGELTDNRMPTISANLSEVANIDPESVIMRVASHGKVDAVFDPETQVISWKVKRKLRARNCEVSVQWRLLGESKYQKPMVWGFRINREASYQPSKPE